MMVPTNNHYQKLAADSNLSRSQLLFWLGQKLVPGVPLYNMTLAFHINGAIDPVRFELAFQQLVNESDALRTIFEERDGIPMQRVLPEMTCPVAFLDWSNDVVTSSGFHSWAETRSQVAFDLSACLFDSVLIRISDINFIWFFNQHHLTTDAWSVSVLYKRLSMLYEEAAKGDSDRKLLLPSFARYVEHERGRRPHPVVDAYWETRSGMLPRLVPLYGFRGNSSESRSERLTLTLGAERSDRLRALAREPDVRSWTEDLSLFTIFATTLFAFLYRVSGQSALAIGCPAHNRPTTVFKETPGLFIEVFPLLADIGEEDSFNSLLQRLRRDTNEFLRCAQAGAGSPELSRGFNVVLNYIHASFGDFGGNAVHSEWIHPGHCDPRHHLRLQIHDFDGSGSIQLHFDANCEVFAEAKRKDLPVHFLNLLDAFITDRNQLLGKPRLISSVEYDRLVRQPNTGPKVTSPISTVLQLIGEQVARRPLSTAIECKDTHFTYQQLNERADQLARLLMAKGAGPGQRIGILQRRSPDLIISILATWKIGAAYVPVSADYPGERIRHIVQDAKISFLITHRDLTILVNQSDVNLICLDDQSQVIAADTKPAFEVQVNPEHIAYIMYTSGSTGMPKGVVISHDSLSNYIRWASSYYVMPENPVMPLFTSIGFDLTVTSLFLPLTVGGTVLIYEEDYAGPDLSLLRVIDDNRADIIKLTPSHLALLKDRDLSGSRIITMILGGEDLKRELAESIRRSHNNGLLIYNEYGPTEATVGCIVHLYNFVADEGPSVPIGRPISETQAFVLDRFGNPVPAGVTGELYLSGKGLGIGYWNQEELTRETFVLNPFLEGALMYRTGDLARINDRGEFEYQGRIDEQVKVGGIRIEPVEIEIALSAHPEIRDCVVVLQQYSDGASEAHERNCARCGLTSRYPKTEFDEEGICNLCRAFETYEEKTKQYFRTMDDLRAVFSSAKGAADRKYDCLALLSGGKDSTYALARLVEMDLRVLAFTLDNGYISGEAKQNIGKVVEALGVDHIYGSTAAMNAIFVDSLHRHHNVCDGCFKTIYTLSTQIALEKDIPFIVTGLSRGQFFETRLTEEVFRSSRIDIDSIDKIVLDARKAYHRVDDAVRRLLDVSIFESEDVFDRVHFVDFYRYCDVSLDEMLAYLDRKLPWVRPSDTGRSTNCLINKAGIWVHKKKKGYSNYAFPYSWDVRVGHKDRDAALAEVQEVIEETEVRQILDEIGYNAQVDRHREQRLVAFYESRNEIQPDSLIAHLSARLPHYMIPTKFVRLEDLPRTPNAKVDRKGLSALEPVRSSETADYEAPRNEIEDVLAGLWREVLNVERVSIHDNFLALGGFSLAAIRLMARINEALDLQLPVNRIFEFPTVASLSEFIEHHILTMLRELENDRKTP